MIAACRLRWERTRSPSWKRREFFREGELDPQSHGVFGCPSSTMVSMLLAWFVGRHLAVMSLIASTGLAASLPWVRRLL